MALSYAEFVEAYKRHFAELIYPIFTKAVYDEVSIGSGDVWQYISKLIVRGVDQYVYAVYKPKKPFYKRRGKRGGLGDPENVEITVSPPILTDEGIECGLSIANLTVAGTIYGEDDDGVLRKIPGDGSYIEDQILGGTGYVFPRSVNAEGDFHQPRNFYQVFDDEYDPVKAGQIILSKIDNDIRKCEEKAMELAFMDIMK